MDINEREDFLKKMEITRNLMNGPYACKACGSMLDVRDLYMCSECKKIYNSNLKHEERVTQIDARREKVKLYWYSLYEKASEEDQKQKQELLEREIEIKKQKTLLYRLIKFIRKVFHCA